MKIIFSKKILAIVLVFISVCANANTLSDYMIFFAEPGYLLASLWGFGLLALGRLRQV